MKKCTKCGIEKDFSQFHKRQNHPTGYACECKECTKLKYKSRAYRDKLNESLRKKTKEDIEFRDMRRRCNKKYRSENKEKIAKYNKEYRTENKEYFEKYRAGRKSEMRIYSQQHYIDNKELRSKQVKEWQENNKDKLNKITRDRVKNDPLFALRKRVSCRIKAAMVRGSFNFTKDTIKLIGCDMETLKRHLGRQFKKGMTWKNNTKSGWHIDHKIPLASAKTEEELLILCHYTNLQPLWAKENLSKNNKILPTQMTLTL